MFQFEIDAIRFSASPVALLKCWLGIGWRARGDEREIREFAALSGDFFPFLFARDSDTPVDQFCDQSTAELDDIVGRHGLRTDFVHRFVSRLKVGLGPRNREQASRLAEQYARRVATWLASPLGRCGAEAVRKMSRWGVFPPHHAGLGAVGSFGNAVFGKYVPSLRAVCVQLDVISHSDRPELHFLETLLHEQVHAAIDAAIGTNDRRAELVWLNELAAVLTSQLALRSAAEDLLPLFLATRVAAHLDEMRAEQQYGDLAAAVMAETGDGLLAWKAWQRIAALPEPDRRSYARDRIITPILRELGWRVRFPYAFGNKRVTVFR